MQQKTTRMSEQARRVGLKINRTKMKVIASSARCGKWTRKMIALLMCSETSAWGCTCRKDSDKTWYYHKGAARENSHEDVEQWGEEEKMEVHQTHTMPRWRKLQQFCLNVGARNTKKEGKTKNKMEAYHQNRKNTHKLVNKEQGQGCSCQLGNVETICGGLMYHNAGSRHETHQEIGIWDPSKDRGFFTSLDPILSKCLVPSAPLLPERW